MRTISINVHGSIYDKEYGRLDFAPRVMGRGEFDGSVGYLLSWNPVENTFTVQWDDSNDREFLKQSEFQVISGLVH